MTQNKIIVIAKRAYKEAKLKDFRDQMKPLETWMGVFIINFYHFAVLEERKDCERLCEEQGKLIGSTGITCAAAIRARGQA